MYVFLVTHVYVMVGTEDLLITVSHFETPGTSLEFTVVWAKTSARCTASRHLVWHYCSLYKITLLFSVWNTNIFLAVQVVFRDCKNLKKMSLIFIPGCWIHVHDVHAHCICICAKLNKIEKSSLCSDSSLYYSTYEYKFLPICMMFHLPYMFM